MSQFKNLSHAYVHEVGNPAASTFWAGLGAVRAAAFQRVGGFDERFVRPSVEDIDLGYRLAAAGYPLRLDPAFRGTHLKRWTLRQLRQHRHRRQRHSVDAVDTSVQGPVE